MRRRLHCFGDSHTYAFDHVRDRGLLTETGVRVMREAFALVVDGRPAPFGFR
jgi:hypothetical protein